MNIELIADTSLRSSTFKEGITEIIDLLHRLENLPEISQGWEFEDPVAGNVLLSKNESLFIDRIYLNMGQDADEISLYYAVVGSSQFETVTKRGDAGYFIDVQFGKDNPQPTTINFNCSEQIASFDFFRRFISILMDWTKIQHIGISDMQYRFHDAPHDVRRRGIGWAGWVPFQLTAQQVPEAYFIEPLLYGTLLACQEHWIPGDPDSIFRAQSLDLRLNSLGILPTLPELAGGDWGNPNP